MRCLITGVAGFVGSHLIELLLKIPNILIYGADGWYTKKDNISHLLDNFQYLEFDMTNYSSVMHLLELVKPDKTFLLAAQSFVPTSLGFSVIQRKAVVRKARLSDAARCGLRDRRSRIKWKSNFSHDHRKNGF